MARAGWAVWIGLAGLGCRGIHTPQERATWLNTGRLCIVPGDVVPDLLEGTVETVSYADGAGLVAVITFSECEACPRQPFGSCQVAAGEGTWVVESEASYIIEANETNCSDDCQVLTTQCDVPPVVGSTAFEHGGDILVVEVPSTTSSFCVGEPVAPVVTSE